MCFSPLFLGIFDRFLADGDEVMDGLADGSTEESNDIWMERSFPGFPEFLCFGEFHTGVLIGIFTMNLADGWMDRTDDGHTDGQMEFQVASQLGGQTDKSCDLHMDRLHVDGTTDR